MTEPTDTVTVTQEDALADHHTATTLALFLDRMKQGDETPAMMLLADEVIEAVEGWKARR